MALALWSWRSQLFTVGRPGAVPRVLEVSAEKQRTAVALDVVLPSVPVGMRRLHQGERVLLLHYWAPWERNARAQAAALDSLSRLEGLDRLDLAIVCFDPFPSVARFVARQRLRLVVLIDGQGQLRRTLPCPSIPFTYVLDAKGRIAIAQPGEVDWLAAGTRAVLARLIEEAPARTPAASLFERGEPTASRVWARR
jgi:hypothetical protein